jgi:hypothetical protein
MRTERGSRSACWVAGRLLSIAAAASWVALAGCGGDDGGGGDDDSGDEEEERIARRASEVRELDFLEDVEVVRMTRAEYRAEAEENAEEIDEEELRELADTYGRLGFFPLDADLRPILAESTDWVGASYSPRAKVITIVEEDPGDAPDSTQVHEFVHALQDQHFDLVEYDGSTSDEFLARRAVVEGDATLAEGRFAAQDMYGGDLDGYDWAVVLDAFHTSGAELLETAEYPLFLDYPSFVYPYGLEYTAANLLGADFDAPTPHDWGLEDELFTERPPATVRQVIRIGFELDPVQVVGLDAVPPALADRLEAASWDTLGAWYIHLLFYDRQPFADATELALAWRADRVLFVRDSTREGAVATVWGSAWESADAASRVASTLDVLYGRTPSGDPPPAGTAADGESLWIEQRESRVVAIKNLAPELAQQMADAAFAPPPTARAARSRPPLVQRLRKLVY